MRPGDDPPRRGERRDRGPAGGRRGQDRRDHARARGCAGGAAGRRAVRGGRCRGGAGGRGRGARRDRGRAGSRRPAAWLGAGNLVRAPPRRSPRHRGARGPGSGRAVRGPCRPAKAGGRRDPAPREGVSRQAPVRRDPPGHGARASRPPARPPPAKVRARERRGSSVQLTAPLGPDQHAGRGTEGAAGSGCAPDRHARRAPGAAAVRRKPAEGHDRPLARVGVHRAPLQ